MTALYVYAIADRPVRLRTRGIFGRPVRSVPVARLHAVVEQAGRTPKPSLGRLKKQSLVLASLVGAGVDALPVRFGTRVASRDELQETVTPRVAELRKALRHIKGCVQMTVRITVREAKLPAARGGRAPATGAAYLRARVAEDRSRRHHPVVCAITTATTPHVRGSRVEFAAATVTLFHLVQRTRVPRYLAALGREAERHDAEVRVSGPLAPFAFVEIG